MQKNSEAGCRLCPRRCGARRAENETGFCGCGDAPVVARADLHLWEEPCISGENGSGTVFFGGCGLRCRFCQNSEISRGASGRRMDANELRAVFFELIDKGAHNINLVTPTHFAPAVSKALKGGLPVPVVYNCGGYESVETLRTLAGKIQVYMPDMKYALSEPAKKYSRAADYPEIAKKAIIEMYRQTGNYEIDENGLLVKGVLIRHLVLPGNLENTFGVIDWVSETFEGGEVLFSLMSQYTPVNRDPDYPELNRRLTPEEYEAAEAYLFDSGIEDGFVQELSSAEKDYIPDFDMAQPE